MYFFTALGQITVAILLIWIPFSHVEAKNWAVVICGYDYYRFTYGMEAAAYKVAKLLENRGISKENTILISPDTVAYNPMNPVPGWIGYGISSDKLNCEEKNNAYEGITVDHTSDTMTTSLFYELLKGNASAFEGRDSKKVLNSGPQDNVFIYWIALGGPGVITLTKSQYIWADDFIPLLEDLAEKKRFKKMFLHLEAGYVGMMVDDYLETDKKIMVMTPGGRYHSLEACHYNEYLQAYTSICSSYPHWKNLNGMLCENKMGKNNIFDLYANIISKSNLSPANLYGQFRIGRSKLSEFVGQKPQCDIDDYEAQNNKNEINRRASNSKSIMKTLSEDPNISVQEKAFLENKMNAIVGKCKTGARVSDAKLRESLVARLDKKQAKCYRNSFERIRTKCFNDKNDHLFLDYANVLAKLCETGISEVRILELANEECS